MKRAIAGILTAVLALGTASCAKKSEKITTDATGEFVCEVLDVGKADAMILKSVNPEYVVITCSEKNPPEDKVLEILNHLKTNVYLSENGNIEVISDGKNIQINQ